MLQVALSQEGVFLQWKLLSHIDRDFQQCNSLLFVRR